MREIWREIKKYPNYKVSNLGRVYSRISDKMLRPGLIRKTGYLTVCLSKRGKGQTEYVHRLVAEAFIGQIPPGYDVDHINGKKTDNRAENLRIVTRSENIRAAIASGQMQLHTIPRDVLKRLYNDERMGIEEIANIYGVSMTPIRRQIKAAGMTVRTPVEQRSINVERRKAGCL